MNEEVSLTEVVKTGLLGLAFWLLVVGGLFGFNWLVAHHPLVVAIALLFPAAMFLILATGWLLQSLWLDWHWRDQCK